MAICANCGAEAPARFRFCGACGAPLEQLPEREVRKLVTVLFSDLVDSTALGERLDPERWRQVLGRYFEAIEQLIAAHGGLVEKFVGDAVMAVFGLPRAHEDDALRALKAALAVRQRLPQLAEETGINLAFRTGINSGEVVAGGGQTLATGDPVNVAARLEQAAGPGEILLGAETVRLLGQAVAVDPLAPLSLQGKAEPVQAYRFRALAKAAREPQSRFVGRRRELALLRDAFERVVEECELHLVTLLGPAGIGKSRLACEFADSRAGEAQIARGRCLSYGQALSYWPLVEALRTLGEPAAAALEQLVEGGATSPEQLAWSVQQALEQVAQERPLLLLLEDLHWAEPALLDLLDSVAELSRDAPILLLCLARPELLEQRPHWGGGKLNATSLLLEPLAQEDAESLLSCLDCPAHAEERALALAAGNPLFLEELSAYLTEGGGDDQLPPRIQALLQARLDLLPEPQRLLLATAALEGMVFHRGALETLVPEELRHNLVDQLAALTRTLLVRPTQPELEGERAFRFRHQLIRDTAYGELPKAGRADLHEQFAHWLEKRDGNRAELGDISSYHLEQAALSKHELGSADTALDEQAVSALIGAAERARRRTDMRSAASLRRRALRLLDKDDPRTPDFQLELGRMLSVLGAFGEAEQLLDEAELRTRDASVAIAIRLARLQMRMASNPTGQLPSAMRRESAEAIRLFEQRGDQHQLAHAWLTLGLGEWLELQLRAAMPAFEEAAEHARVAGDRPLEMLAHVARTLFRGATCISHAAALREGERLAARFPGEPLVIATLLLLTAFREFECGGLAQARTHAREALSIARKGFPLVATGYTFVVARFELLSGHPDEAERLALGAIGELKEHGERNNLAWGITVLADVRSAQGRYKEALGLADEAERLAGPHDRDAGIFARSARARAHIGLGELAEAKEAATAAAAMADATDSHEHRAHAQYALAEVLAAAEEFPAALAAAKEAQRLWTSLDRALLKPPAAVLVEQIEHAMTAAEAPTFAT